MKYQDKAELLKNATEVTSDFFVKNDEPFNRVNLTMLADYLEGGKLKAGFDMSKYSSDYWLKTECGSVGCAVGHGPYAGIPKQYSEDWDVYSNRVFIDRGMSSEWCFGLFWKNIDNSAQGAAKRIRYLLKHGNEAVGKIIDRGYCHLRENYAEIINA